MTLLSGKRVYYEFMVLEYSLIINLIKICLFLFLSSLFLCYTIVLFPEFGFQSRADLDEKAVQSAHSGSIPRVGGLPIFACIILSAPLSAFYRVDLWPIVGLALTACPIFLVGLIEDLGFSMSSKRRLLASILSGFLFIVFFGVWINRLGIPGLDIVLSFGPAGILFSLFAAAGVVNAFNLIDGLNGLSSYVTVSIAISLAIISYQVNHFDIAIFLLMLSSAVLGFAVLNFPFGKVFLGDAGAYTLGHILVWTSIFVTYSETNISPFSILLIFFWPVADTILAIWRRLYLGIPADRPDRLHFHQLVMRILEIHFFGRGRRSFTNPAATLVILPMVSVPQVIGVIFFEDLLVTACVSVLMFFLFFVTYTIGVNFAKKKSFFH